MTTTPRALVDATDLDAVCQLMETTKSLSYFKLPEGRPRGGRFVIKQVAGAPAPNPMAGIALFESKCSYDYVVRGRELSDCYLIRLAWDGVTRLTVGETQLGSRCTITGPGALFTLAKTAYSRSLLLTLPRKDVDLALESRFGAMTGRTLVFEPELRDSDPSTSAWIKLVGQWAQLSRSNMLARSPLAAKHYEQMLVHGLIDVQPHSLTDPSEHRTPAISAGVLRAAVDYCHDYAGEPITVADIAAAVHIGVRALQREFRERMDTTPMEYLRKVRLSKAHEELRAISRGQASGTVSEVASRWGFAHLGRFAQAYRQVYGTPPSQTLAG